MPKRRAVLVALLLAALLGSPGRGGSAAAAESGRGDAKGDGRARIAVISAFAPELTRLLDEATLERKVSVNGIQFYLAKLGGKEVVLFLSGISMVNAAANTQLVLERFNVKAIVFSGIAGGVNPALHIGDVTVAARWSQYLQADLARQVGNGYQLPNGDKKILPNFGFFFPQPVTVTTAARPEGETHLWFPVDRKLLEQARAIKGEVESRFERCTSAGACLAERPRFVVGGNGVSGMAFVDNKAVREYTFRTFDANVLDEESAAVATVAYTNQVPVIIFRSLSDLAGGGSGENQLPTFFQLAANNSAAAVITFLRKAKF